MSTSTKDLDEDAFRNSKPEAVQIGMEIGDAATEAVRMWVASKRQTRIRDREVVIEAARETDQLGASTGKRRSGAEEIRKKAGREEAIAEASLAHAC